MNVEKLVLALDLFLDLFDAMATHFGLQLHGLPIAADHATQLGTLYAMGLLLKHSKIHRWHIKFSALIQWIIHQIEMGRQSTKHNRNHTAEAKIPKANSRPRQRPPGRVKHR